MTRLSAVLACGATLALFAAGVAAVREPSQFTCKRFMRPRVMCEAKYVWPEMPVWNVYYPGTQDVVDQERGIVVYPTLPEEKFAVLEMCHPGLRRCLRVYGGWFGGKLLFHRKGLEEP